MAMNDQGEGHDLRNEPEGDKKRKPSGQTHAWTFEGAKNKRLLSILDSSRFSPQIQIYDKHGGAAQHVVAETEASKQRWQDSFDLTTIIFALLAAFVVWKLRAILGTRTGAEKPPRNPFVAGGETRPRLGEPDTNVIPMPGARRSRTRPRAAA